MCGSWSRWAAPRPSPGRCWWRCCWASPTWRWAGAFALPLTPSHSIMVNEITTVALFAMSLDLILSHTGIVSLGHVAIFGFGAYSAALFAKLVMPGPTVELVFASVLCALLGPFEFDLFGRNAAWYSLTVVLVLFLLMRRIVHSPFGATLKAICDNRLRAMAIGVPVAARMVMPTSSRQPSRGRPARC